MEILSYHDYDNGYSFFTKGEDDMSTMQNSRVNEDIWEFDYIKFKAPASQCKWVKNNNDI